MANQDLISVIMPTYNRAEQVGKMINQLLHQTYQNFELIIVNDGSTDDTKNQLSIFEKNDNRIRSITIPNGGPSNARNIGIEKAHGYYITFIDDDDEIPNNYLELLMAKENEDIDYIIDSYSIDHGAQTLDIVNYPEFKTKDIDTGINYIFTEMQKYRYCFYTIGKRYKNKILNDYNIRFKTNLSLGEDRPFALDYLCHCKSLKIINKHSYIIKNIPDIGERLSKSPRPIDDLWSNFKANYDYLKNYSERYNKKLDKIAIEAYRENFLLEKVYYFIIIPRLKNGFTKKEYKFLKENILPELKKIKYSNVRNKKLFCLNSLLLLLGIKNFTKITKLIIG